MKFFVIAFAVIAAVAADVSHLPLNEYLPPAQEAAPQSVPQFLPQGPPSSEYLPPVQQQQHPAPVEPVAAHVLADDGYRYKTHRRVVYRRNRRDVSHLPLNEYLPPAQEAAPQGPPSSEYLPPVQQQHPAPVEPVAAHVLADDGYRYKTHRRVVYRRNRRDVSHLPLNEYLPPAQEAVPQSVPQSLPQGLPTNEYLPPVQQQHPAPVEPVAAHVLADDGYRYKTHRRVVYRRNRRDVSHLPLNEYLPPAQEAVPQSVPQSLPQGLPTNEYLPPVQQQQHPAPVEPVAAHVLADDGYRYKTHRRVVYRRNRRDVSHLPLNEYLPPAQEAAPQGPPSSEYLPPVQQQHPAPVEPVAAHVLADDGYRYKTHRRVVYRRNRRDVSHLPLNEYLPPVQETVPVEVAPIQEVSNAVVEEPVTAHELADDGYRYKTQRRVVYRRNRRDVSHLVSNEYLPPVQEAAPVLDAPVQQVSFIPESAPAHELADDGYRYKTQRRVVYRRNRRDVSHLPSNDYLPPAQDAPLEIVPFQPVTVLDEAAPSHELADDGYRYKTQRRVVYRRNRRDVSHLPLNEYLPPVQQELGSVPAPVNDYLPPAQNFEPAPAHQLSDDGYRYKTQRRVVFRRH